MSGIDMLGGALLLFVVIVGPCILVSKLLGAAATTGAAVLQLHAQGGPAGASPATQRALARLQAAQRAAERA